MNDEVKKTFPRRVFNRAEEDIQRAAKLEAVPWRSSLELAFDCAEVICKGMGPRGRLPWDLHKAVGGPRACRLS